MEPRFRYIPFSIQVGVRALAREVLVTAEAFASGQDLKAYTVAEALWSNWADVQAGLVGEDEEGTRGLLASLHEEAQGEVSEGQIAPHLRAVALTRLLVELVEAGWSVVMDGARPFLRAPLWGVAGAAVEDKARIQRASMLRVRAQMSQPRARAFIAALEAPDAEAAGESGRRPISALIASGPALAESLRREGAAAIKPYVVRARAEDGVDPHTGLRLIEVFRYLRTLWSFPYQDTPGRTLPLLIRDAGQPGHPVCGLLCLSSPVSRLGTRDDNLGWTPAWLQATAAALCALAPLGEEPTRASLSAALERLCAALRQAAQERTCALSGAALLEEVSRALGVASASHPKDLSAALAALPTPELRARLHGARERLLRAIVDEVRGAFSGVSLSGLVVDSWDAALSDPERAAAAFEHQAKAARERWLEQRRADRGSPSAESDDALFKKKRAGRAGQLLRAWSELAPLAGELDSGGLDDAASLRWLSTLAWGEDRLPHAPISPKRASVGARAALTHLQERMISSHVMDVSVCGAIPPYNHVLGGKLAALTALSAEVAAHYEDSYRDQVSEIKSKMSGEQVRRPSDLRALTTMSFYPVNSTQYNRIQLPAELGGGCWRLLGESGGHGTTHLSAELSGALQALLNAEKGATLASGAFGEGPSAKLRKLRDGFACLGLPGDELLRHGVGRLVYIADTSRATTLWGQGEGATPPALAGVVEHWRERWLAPRLRAGDALTQRLDESSVEDALVSYRLRRGSGEGAEL